MIRFLTSLVSTFCGCLGVALLLLAPSSDDLFAAVNDNGAAAVCLDGDGQLDACKNASLTNCGKGSGCEFNCSCQRPLIGLYCQCCTILGC
jgi:hypothetical protein